MSAAAGAGGGARESDWIFHRDCSPVVEVLKAPSAATLRSKEAGGIIDAGGGGLDDGDIFAGD